jgi:hypothetical protein
LEASGACTKPRSSEQQQLQPSRWHVCFSLWRQWKLQLSLMAAPALAAEAPGYLSLRSCRSAASSSCWCGLGFARAVQRAWEVCSHSSCNMLLAKADVGCCCLHYTSWAYAATLQVSCAWVVCDVFILQSCACCHVDLLQHGAWEFAIWAYCGQCVCIAHHPMVMHGDRSQKQAYWHNADGKQHGVLVMGHIQGQPGTQTCSSGGEDVCSPARVSNDRSQLFLKEIVGLSHLALRCVISLPLARLFWLCPSRLAFDARQSWDAAAERLQRTNGQVMLCQLEKPCGSRTCAPVL